MDDNTIVVQATDVSSVIRPRARPYTVFIGSRYLRSEAGRIRRFKSRHAALIAGIKYANTVLGSIAVDATGVRY